MRNIIIFITTLKSAQYCVKPNNLRVHSFKNKIGSENHKFYRVKASKRYWVQTEKYFVDNENSPFIIPEEYW